MNRRGPGRPMGEVATALLSAWSSGGPATVAQAAQRACVGYNAARFKASALVRSGALVAVSDARPRVLAAADVASVKPGAAPSVHEALEVLGSFWESRPPGGWPTE